MVLSAQLKALFTWIIYFFQDTDLVSFYLAEILISLFEWSFILNKIKQKKFTILNAAHTLIWYLFVPKFKARTH